MFFFWNAGISLLEEKANEKTKIRRRKNVPLTLGTMQRLECPQAASNYESRGERGARMGEVG